LSSVTDVRLIRLVTDGHLHPEIGLLDEWEHAGEAIEALLARRVRGNAVLTIGEQEPDSRR
jgi:hypothetical protein